MLKLLTTLIAAVILSGCTTSLNLLRNIEPLGTPFEKYLSYEYLQFAEAEADQYDWIDSSHFARKGLKLAKGVYVGPEELIYWDLNDDVLPTLNQARYYLIQVLEKSSVKKNFPEKAAKAQFFFDCWVEQQEENWQVDHIAYCRENFYKTLDELMQYANFSEGYVDNQQEEILPWKNPSLPSGFSDVTSSEVPYTVYFEFDKSCISEEGLQTLNYLVNKLKNQPDYKITVNGYTDSAGSSAYNLKLSKNRAMAIKEALVKIGIAADKIEIFAFGESDLRVPTKDNVKEQKNRVAEIIVE